jgi:hypothetical protein
MFDLNLIQVGDLVKDICPSEEAYGIVLGIRNDVEVPGLIEVLWFEENTITKLYADDLVIVSRTT